MKTTINISEKKGVLFTILAVFLSIYAKAESDGKLLPEVSKGTYVGFYIIGGVFGFGLLIYLISKIASKYIKEEDKKIIHTIPHHRHSHHHRVIKKSA